MINKVTHNVTQVTAAATKVLMVLVRDSVIDAGRVVERGTHAELVALGGQYATLYENQFEQA